MSNTVTVGGIDYLQFEAEVARGIATFFNSTEERGREILKLFEQDNPDALMDVWRDPALQEALADAIHQAVMVMASARPEEDNRQQLLGLQCAS